MRHFRAPAALLLVGSLTLLAAACSSSSRRDQYYGTNVGAEYEPAEAGVIRADAGATGGGDGDGGITDAAPDGAHD